MIEINKLYSGDCMKYMSQIEDGRVNLTLTDIPYGEVNRDSNGLRKLDKENADIMTFDLQEFLTELYRVTSSTIIIFCGKEQLSEIHKFFSDKQKKEQRNCKTINLEENKSKSYEWSTYLFVRD